MTKNKANDAWMQQVQQQQARRGHKRRAHTMIARGDPQYVASVGGVSGRRTSPRPNAPKAYADLPDDLVRHTDANDFLDNKPRSSAPRAVSTAAPAPPAIRTGVDAVNFLGTIPEVVENPMAFSHQ